jgi:hypothetical protein
MREPKDDHERKATADVKNHGWHVLKVLEDDKGPAFTYIRAATSSCSISLPSRAADRPFSIGAEPLVVVHRARQQVERHLVGRAASLGRQARQLRFEFGRNLQIHKVSAGAIPKPVNVSVSGIGHLGAFVRGASLEMVETSNMLERAAASLLPVVRNGQAARPGSKRAWFHPPSTAPRAYPSGGVTLGTLKDGEVVCLRTRGEMLIASAITSSHQL